MIAPLWLVMIAPSFNFGFLITVITYWMIAKEKKIWC